MNLLDINGVGLAARILSCISLHRDIDDNIFSEQDPSNYLSTIFEKQFFFLNYNYQLTDRLNIKGLELSKDDYIDDEYARDNLHIKLFNRTWKTLTMSGDPLNDYKPWIHIIEKRQKK